MASVADLVKKGLRNPSRILPFLKSKALSIGPRTQDQPDGLVTFSEGHYASTASDRAEFSGNLYVEITTIQRLLDDFLPEQQVSRSLEIGCGYGRQSPWLAEFSKHHCGLDIDATALRKADIQYPFIDFTSGMGQNIPFDSDSFDFVFTWTVLMHVSEDTISAVADEIRRVTKHEGLVMITECVTDEEGPAVWGRSEDAYGELLDMELIYSELRPIERSHFEDNSPTHYEGDHPATPGVKIMLYRNTGK
jgi:SAM-dependent methyltransferase